MKVVPLELAGLMLIELKVHGDARGFFVERFQEDAFRAAGLPDRFAQDNHSRSAPGVLRGLHYQVKPAQGKLVGVVRGRIWDVAVDVRPNSPSYGRHVSIELTDINGRLLWIPPGFAHGFCVLSDVADFSYKCTVPYAPEAERSILWNDPALGIDWPVASPRLSPKDAAALPLACSPVLPA